MELAHASRVATMGQLTGSITHELKQPMTAARTHASAALRWLNETPPEGCACLDCDGHRSSRRHRQPYRRAHEEGPAPEGGFGPQRGDPGGDRADPQRSHQDRRYGAHAACALLAAHLCRPGATATGDAELDRQRHPSDQRFWLRSASGYPTQRTMTLRSSLPALTRPLCQSSVNTNGILSPSRSRFELILSVRSARKDSSMRRLTHDRQRQQEQKKAWAHYELP
jgi:hypothetical protein